MTRPLDDGPVRSPGGLLQDGAFRRLWAIGGIGSTMRWLEILVVGFFVFDLTGSAFIVSVVGLMRMLPLLLLGVFMGIMADRVNRKILLTGGMAMVATTSALVGGLVALDRIEVWHLAAGSFVSGMVWAGEFSVRRAMIGDVVGMERIGRAMGIDSATNNASRAVGPVTGGFLVALIGVEGAFFMGAGLHAIAAVMAVSVAYRPPPRSVDVRPIANLVEGLRYVRSSRLIMATLLVTVIMNLWAFPYQHMVPVIAAETLGVGALGLGFLSSAEGLGALLGALAIVMLVRPHQYTRLYLLGCILFLITILLFSRSAWYPASLAFLFIGGFGVAAFGTMQSVIVISATPPAVRGRVMGVLSMTIGAGPVGALHVGLMAALLGAPLAVMIIALEGMAALLTTLIASRELRQARAPAPEPSPLPSPGAGNTG